MGWQGNQLSRSFCLSNLSRCIRYLLAALYVLLQTATSQNSSQIRPLSRFEFAQPQMGTLFRIVCYAEDANIAKATTNAAFSRIAELNDIMSDYSPTSELTRLNERAGGPPQEVSPDLFYVLCKGQQMSELTNGAFDVTVGPVVRLWRRARRRHELPSPERLAQALGRVGFKKLWLDEATHSVQLSESGMALDLGGIAKGYAADEALKVLVQSGMPRSLVAAGGDITVGSPPPDSGGWKVAISPLNKADKPMRHLLLKEAAVSTSGDAEQYVEVQGKRYSHIVDPRTGIGLVGHRSVTVVSPNGITSDSLATALSVMGSTRGLELADSLKDTAALFVEATQDGVQILCSKRWKDDH